MKRFKFPILLKVILAGLLVSFVASGVAIVVSYNNQVNAAKKQLVKSIDHTLDEIAYYYESDEQSATTLGNLYEIREHVESDYNIRVGLGQEKTLEDFPSFKEFEAYYKDKDTWIFPKEGEIGISLPMLNFRVFYRDFLSSLLDAHMSSGAVASYCAFKVNNRLVFLGDSRMNSIHSESVEYYQVPGTYYELREGDYSLKSGDSKYSAYTIYGRTTRFYTVYADEEKQNELALFFIEYDESVAGQESLSYLRSEIFILALTAGAIVLIYALLSYFMFVRNINRLSKASTEISKRLADKSLTSPKEINIHSHDEMANLATSLNALQQAVIDYTNIIEKEAGEKQKMNAELEVANRIQLEALPSSSFNDSNLSLRTSIKPAKEVGGDFYDYFYIDETHFAFLIADVSGKGIPASLFMMKSKTMIKNAILSSNNLKEALYTANNRLVANNQENLFVTAFVGVINTKTRELKFVNAGHEKPYIISKGKVFKLDGDSNFVLGEIDDYDYIEERIRLHEGDKLFMFTDGLNESINNKNEEFGYERIADSLANNKDKNLDEIVKDMNDSLHDFVGESEPFDDVTIITLEMEKRSLFLTYKEKDYSIITDATDKFNDKFFYLPLKAKSEVGIILDELLNNLVSYENRDDLTINLEFRFNKNELTIKIDSNGSDYNPFKNHKDKYLTSENENDQIGGFGIKIVKDLVTSYSYEYKNKHSLITLIKKI